MLSLRASALAITVAWSGHPFGEAALGSTTDGDYLRCALPKSMCCAGDCNMDGLVTIDEVILKVNILLGKASPESCHEWLVLSEPSISDVIQDIQNLLHGCP